MKNNAVKARNVIDRVRPIVHQNSREIQPSMEQSRQDCPSPWLKVSARRAWRIISTSCSPTR